MCKTPVATGKLSYSIAQFTGVCLGKRGSSMKHVKTFALAVSMFIFGVLATIVVLSFVKMDGKYTFAFTVDVTKNEEAIRDKTVDAAVDLSIPDGLNGEYYIAEIDKKLGVWLTETHKGTFETMSLHHLCKTELEKPEWTNAAINKIIRMTLDAPRSCTFHTK